MKTALLIFSLSLLTSSLFAQVPFSWDADASAAAPGRKDVYQGETVPLRPTWTGEGVRTNGWAFALLWQTNGMGGAWWTDTADAFSWKPSRDCGADRYTLFIRASAPGGGVSYRANAVFRMLPSPGFSPAAMPAPELYPDLAARLAPYMAGYTQGLALASSVADEAFSRSSADGELRAQILSLAENGTITGGVVSAGSASDSAVWRDSSNSNLFARLENGTGTVWSVSVAERRDVSCALSPDFGVLLERDWYFRPSQLVYVCAPGTLYQEDRWSIYFNVGDEGLFQVVDTQDGCSWVAWASGPPATAEVVVNPEYTCQGTATFEWLVTETVTTQKVDTFVYSGAVAAATNDLWQAVAALRARSDAADNSLAAATNYIIRTYLINSNAWITADFSNRTVAVSLVSTNGLTNTVSVGGSANAVDPQATNLLWLALGAGLSAKADKAWGRYAPDGSANPDPGFMTFLNAPATLFGGGCSWSTCGTYAALSASGTVAFNSGSNGVFSIGPDSTNRFGYTVGGSVFVGAVPDSLRTHFAGTTNGYAEITYAYSGGGFPTLWFAPSLAVDFQIVSSSVWTDNLDGTATATAPALSASGFFKATTAVGSGTIFTSSMPARFDGGVFGSALAPPVRYDSTVTITAGGHTYRIPAQLAE